MEFSGTPYTLSVSVPLDTMYGFCETALKQNDSIVYNARQFESADELVEEICRVGQLVKQSIRS